MAERMIGGLPTKADFLEDHGCLDAQEAWKNFGGLTIDDAYEKFCDRPEIYSEDFMHMGEHAFAYYFGVLDRFVRCAVAKHDRESFEHFGAIRDAIGFHFAEPFDEEAHKERVRKHGLTEGDGLGEAWSTCVTICWKSCPVLISATVRPHA